MKKFVENLILAETIAQRSKDPSSQVGCVITRPDNTVASIGYNGFPKGFPDFEKHFTNKDFKYSYILHAEENAILNCRDISLENYKMFIHGLPCCSNCFSKIVQSGIKTIYYVPTRELRDDEKSKLKITNQLCDSQLNIKLVCIEQNRYIEMKKTVLNKKIDDKNELKDGVVGDD